MRLGLIPYEVIGVGNEFRRDDGAGPAVLARLRDLAPPGVPPDGGARCGATVLTSKGPYERQLTAGEL